MNIEEQLLHKSHEVNLPDGTVDTIVQQVCVTLILDFVKYWFCLMLILFDKLELEGGRRPAPEHCNPEI